MNTATDDNNNIQEKRDDDDNTDVSFTRNLHSWECNPNRWICFCIHNAQNNSSNASPPHSSNASPAQSSNASPPHSSSFGCWAELINSQDPDELELLAEFHRRLTELRASKSGGASIIDAPGQAQQTNEPSKAQGLVLTPGLGGKWSLQPKHVPKTEPTVEPKTEHMAVKTK